MKDIRNRYKHWKPPDNWLLINTIDAHAEGEPLRVIISGFPDIPGDTILACRRYLIENLDYLRTALIWEPRGHADMYGCLITPPVSEQADFGILFFHNDGYSSMCGHGIIAITKVVLEIGMIPVIEPETTIIIDTPAGLVTARARIENGQVTTIYFQNVPSFVVALDQTIEVTQLGQVHYDLAFGGAYYAYVEADNVGLTCTPDNYSRLIEAGRRIKQAIMQSRVITHPFEDDLNFLYGTIFTGPPIANDANYRNVCIFADGEVDRSPTGTGVSGRLAIDYARQKIGIGEPLVIESIIGSRFTGRVIREINFGSGSAITPEIEGRAYITGRHEFLIDPEDPLHHGFILR